MTHNRIHRYHCRGPALTREVVVIAADREDARALAFRMLGCRMDEVSARYAGTPGAPRRPWKGQREKLRLAA